MKTRLAIVLLLLAPAFLPTGASVKVATKHFVISDSVRIFDKENPDGQGYQYTRRVDVDWPVTINGRKSKVLTEYFADRLFNANENRDIFPYYPDDFEMLKDFAGDCVYRSLDKSPVGEDGDFIVKRMLSSNIKPISQEADPMSYWYENTILKLGCVVGNLVFFEEYDDIYLGGAHNMFYYEYHAYDARLKRVITLKDIISNPKKLLRLLPAYDKRDADSKWWKDVTVMQLENFYIKNGKLVFAFAPYSVGPFCDGEVEVAVPLKTLKAKGLLTPYGKRLLLSRTTYSALGSVSL